MLKVCVYQNQSSACNGTNRFLRGISFIVVLNSDREKRISGYIEYSIMNCQGYPALAYYNIWTCLMEEEGEIFEVKIEIPYKKIQSL